MATLRETLSITQPRTPAIGALAIAAGFMGLSIVALYAAGGTGKLNPGLLLVPVVIVGFYFGILPGIATAVLAGLLAGPFMPLAPGDPQATSDWTLRIVFYGIVGALVGYLSLRFHRESAKRVEEALRAEEALWQSKEYLRLSISNAPVVLWSTDANGIFTLSIGGALRDLGLSEGEAVGQSIFDLYKDSPDVVHAMERALSGETISLRLQPISGVTFDGSFVPVWNEEAKVAGVIGIATNITKQSRTEEALRMSEARLQTVIANAPVILWTMDRKGVITFIEGEGLKALGFDPEALTGVSAFDVFTDNEEAQDQVTRAIGGEEFTDRLHLGELTLEGRFTPILTPAGEVEGVIGVATDITERVKLERQLLQADKLTALGQLVAGVAHEVNNPLTAVIGYAQLLLREQHSREVMESLTVIHKETLRASRIVRNLLSFARLQKAERTYGAIQEPLVSILELRAYEMRVNNIEVVREMEPGLAKTMADFNQIQQVFLNIVVNAEQAMAEAQDKGTLLINVKQAGQNIRVEFTDDGPGISSEAMSKLFDPFFTTKKPGTGTGLGLSVCYGIMEEHGGRIWAESRPGRGATFIVELPIVAEEPLAEGVFENNLRG